MKTRIAIAGLVAIAGFAATSIAATPKLAGTWSQSSSGKELVLRPKIKLQPNVGVGAGTSLGGSVGYGSMTRTAIVTEPVSLHVVRSMSLHIAVDGSFEWSITRQHADGASCTLTTRQNKRGSVRQGDSQIIFEIKGGQESFSKSCGGSGNSAIAPSREVYRIKFEGGKMRLMSGSNSWLFNPD